MELKSPPSARITEITLPKTPGSILEHRGGRRPFPRRPLASYCDRKWFRAFLVSSSRPTALPRSGRTQPGYGFSGDCFDLTEDGFLGRRSRNVSGLGQAATVTMGGIVRPAAVREAR